MSCPTGQIWNPTSKRCISLTSPIGKLISSVLTSTIPLFDKEGYVFDPVSGSYLPLSHPYSDIIIEVDRTKGKIICGPGEEFNPESGRCGKASTFSCLAYPPKGEYKPRKYQEDLSDYFVSSREKGILLFHSLGSGKTCTTIGMIDKMIQVYNLKKVYIFTPGSLRENFISQYCSVCGLDPRYIKDRFEFVTYNYSLILSKLPSQSEINDSLIIVDEAHNIVKGYMNESPNYVAIYNLIFRTNSKIILLTGTPVYGSIMSFYFLFCLLRPNYFKGSEEFKEQFVIENGIYKIKDKDFMTKMLSPVISSFTSFQNMDDLPQVTTLMETVPMTDHQYDVYKIERYNEKLAFPPNPTLKFTNPARYKADRARYYLSLIMMKSRQSGNMIYPRDVGDLPDSLSSEFDSKNDGWISPEDVEAVDEISPKTDLLLWYLKKIPGKHMIYSQFKTRYGIYWLQSILEANGISTTLFTGDLNDKQRTQTISAFNSLDNLYGEKYRVILGTESLAEGINVLQTRAIHIFEQDVDEFHINQVVGRVVRFQSHTALKPEERNVTVIRYFAVSPGEAVPFEEVPKERQTSDFLAYQVGTSRQVQVTPLIDFLKTFPVVPDH